MPRSHDGFKRVVRELRRRAEACPASTDQLERDDALAQSERENKELRAELDHQTKAREIFERAASDLADRATGAEDLIAQLCSDLNGAHDEIVKLQGGDPPAFDWPEWTPQANSIRIAERMLGRRLAKTGNWSVFPDGEG